MILVLGLVGAGMVACGGDEHLEVRGGKSQGTGGDTTGGGSLWGKRFGGANSQISTRLAVDSAGNVLVAGYFQDTVDFGGGVLTSAGADDIFLAKFAP